MGDAENSLSTFTFQETMAELQSEVTWEASCLLFQGQGPAGLG